MAANLAPQRPVDFNHGPIHIARCVGLVLVSPARVFPAWLQETLPALWQFRRLDELLPGDAACR